MIYNHMINYIAIFLIGSFIGNILNILLCKFSKEYFIIYSKYYDYSNFYNYIPFINCIFNNNKYKKYNSKIFLIQLLNGLSYLIIVINSNFNFSTIIYLILISILIFLSFIDIEYKIIPDTIHILLITLTFFYIIFSKDVTFINRIFASIIISLPLFIISILTKGNGFGGGDIKLYSSCGFLLGTEKILLSFIISIIFASIFSIFILLKKSNNNIIPFVPFITIGIIISIIYSEEIKIFILFL